MSDSVNTPPIAQRSSVHPLGAGNTTLPRLPLHEIHRPRVIDLLQLNPDARIWSIVAPAGYGKSVVATQWAASCSFPVAWYSLRDNDNQAAQFLSYLLRACERALGQPLEASIDASKPLSENLGSVLRAIGALQHDLAIVLDDVHAVGHPEILQGIGQLCAERPANARIIMISRTEPDIDLDRQRQAGLVVDLREHDLAFRDDEALAFLAAGSGISLSADQLARVTDSSEGWVTGLSLFKLSLKSADPASFDRMVERAEHSSGFVGSYLLEEVIRPLREELRAFLLGISILEYLDADLCDAVLEIGNSRDLLREIDEQNLFIISHTEADAPPRFHHLFSEALRALLDEEYSPTAIQSLHSRAAHYFESRGDLEGTAHHAIRAQDWELAIATLNRLCADIFAAEKTETLWYWLKQLPSDGLLAAGQLASWLAWSLSMTGKRDDVMSILEVVEPVWRANGEWALVGEAALARGYVAFYDCDEPAFIAGSLEAVEYIPETDIIRRMQAWSFRNMALRNIGDRDGAAQARAEAHALVRKLPPEQTWWYAYAEYIEPTWMAIEGRLGEAYDYANHLFTMVSSPTSRDGMIFRGWNATIHLERNELDEAEAIVNDLLSVPAAYWNPVRYYILLSQIAWARGARDRAMELVELALEHGRREKLTIAIYGCEALRAWYWADQGELFLAERWEKTTSLDDVYWMRMFNNFHGGLTIARLAIEMGNGYKASLVCRQLLEESTRRRRYGENVRLHVLHAAARHQLGDANGAISQLSHALRLGHEERFLRSFLDDGQTIAPYLKQPSLIALAPAFVRELSQLFAQKQTGQVALAAQPIEELSGREIEVLSLVADGHSNRAIAATLSIAEPTVRRHLSNIFLKLDVENRTQAVNQARRMRVL